MAAIKTQMMIWASETEAALPVCLVVSEDESGEKGQWETWRYILCRPYILLLAWDYQGSCIL